jgi:serine phosphatase RsbU (regulator of sigma subunit)
MLTKLIGDVLQEPLYTPKIMGHEGIHSELTVPLIFGGEALGVLDVQSEEKDAFGEQDRFLMEALADNIAVAMRNAYLYRSEAWRRQVSDSLREVAGLLSGDVDLEKVLNIILLELERNLPLDLAAIWLVNENELQAEENDLNSLHLAAFRGVGTQELDLDIGFSPQEVLVYNPPKPSKLANQDANEWLRQALVSDQPVIRSSESPFDPLGAALEYEHSYSAIAAPLRAGDQPLGVLMLAHRTSGRYGSESRTMTAAFASYAAVAIENMRLYEAVHEQAWVSTVLLQVAEATQSQTNLNELLSTVIRITPMLVGVKSCLIYLYDEDEMFVPAAASGLDSDQQLEFERWRFAPGDVHAFDQLLVERHPVIVGRDLGNQRLFSIFDPEALPDRDGDVGLLVLVPLFTRDQVLGAFLVDYSEEILIGMGGKPIEELFDERLAIIQGIAQQTAIAVDNIRLLKSQKEEAYISVALLQVAQAVVSSNDLDEALSSIVRVTPILVGVKRTAVFLWNDDRTTFVLSQSYGLQRELEALEFSLGEFPLLDAVKLEDRLLLCSLSADAADSEDALDYWSALPVPDSDDIDSLLEKSSYLLLAFPLSVKGNVLGVFLVEEPDPVPIMNYAGGNANRRLRDKRLEIVTGISQQAALAIQNDRFQSEMLERERLEREMQLARQIQTTFLPHEMTLIPGWDFQAAWKPAREVGGDFYDFFELPGNRLGFVIADVADKGLPAAMYMTLARTLVRASVSQVISPGKVLDRVNDYLVLDAPQGMFVTLVYVVLSLETGELVVANAGHNPPLVLRSSTEKIDRLKRGGMALGVMEGERIREQRISLKPGELLILYTDGVTESFSPAGDMYAEERLHQTILDINKQVIVNGNQKEILAADMLSGIEDSVQRFTQNQPLSDDLTLLIVKRL